MRFRCEQWIYRAYHPLQYHYLTSMYWTLSDKQCRSDNVQHITSWICTCVYAITSYASASQTLASCHHVVLQAWDDTAIQLVRASTYFPTHSSTSVQTQHHWVGELTNWKISLYRDVCDVFHSLKTIQLYIINEKGFFSHKLDGVGISCSYKPSNDILKAW